MKDFDLSENHPAFKDTPISAPAWLWLAYLGILVGIGWLSWPDGAAAVVYTAIFSFQFWTFATFRGITRRYRLIERDDERRGH